MRRGGASYASARIDAFSSAQIGDFSASARRASVELRSWSFLSPQKHGWTTERPPLSWYATAVASFELLRRLPGTLALRLMSAGNYFGDSALVRDVVTAVEASGVAADRWEVLKQSAKAHKNAGHFTGAREVYGEALKLARKARSNDREAYFLLLYAKLCDHYEQKIAWHRALHRIAYERLLRLCKRPRASKQIVRWLQIAEDTYAKVLYASDPETAESLFESAIEKAPPGTDAHIRVLAHLCEARLSHGTGLTNREEVLGILEGTIDEARTLGNDRAWYVRSLRYLQVCRKLYASRAFDAQALPSLVPLLDGESVSRLNAIVTASNLHSDPRSTALALYERAEWRLIMTGTERPERRRERAIVDLEEAMKHLQGCHDLMVNIYHAVITSLGECYAASHQWSDALAIYEGAYSHCRASLAVVESNERALENGQWDGSPELSLLTDDERTKLTADLRHDYRLLSRRALDLGERIQFAQRERLVESAFRVVSRGQVECHSLASEIRKLPIQSSPEVDALLTKIERLLRDWQTNRLEDDLKVVDVAREIDHIIKGFAFVKRARTDQGPIQIRASREILTVLVTCIVENVAQVAPIGPEVILSLEVKEDRVYLNAKDNAGDIDHFQQVIDAINAGRRAESKRDSRGGFGLNKIKTDMAATMYVKEPWSVHPIENGWKCLTIPLGPLAKT